MTLITFLIILGVLIISHEFGHFIVAKRVGARVDEFGLGFPPRLLSFKKGETTYSLNIIPFGGFVKIYGEDLEEVIEDKKPDPARSLAHQSKWQQAAVLAAGVTFNLILAWLLLALALSTTGLPVGESVAPAGVPLTNSHLSIISVAPGSPADKAGLKAGDTLISMRSGLDYLIPTSPEQVQAFTATRAGREIVLGYERQQPKVKTIVEEVGVVPVTGLISDRAAIGLGLETVGTLKLSVFRAVPLAFKLLANLTWLTARGLGDFLFGLVRGHGELLNQVAGPVGLVSLVGTAQALGLGHLLLFTAVISINLAVLNLLPIPALDGGRLLFLLIEAIKRKPLNPKFAKMANLIGFALLILLMVIVTFSDIFKLTRP